MMGPLWHQVSMLEKELEDANEKLEGSSLEKDNECLREELNHLKDQEKIRDDVLGSMASQRDEAKWNEGLANAANRGLYKVIKEQEALLLRWFSVGRGEHEELDKLLADTKELLKSAK